MQSEEGMELKCDFCSSPLVSWWYPVKDFRFTTMAGPSGDTLVLNSTEGFYSCGPCHDMVEADDYTALAENSIVTAIVQSGGLVGYSKELFDWVASFHQKFKDNREGPAQRIEVKLGA